MSVFPKRSHGETLPGAQTLPAVLTDVENRLARSPLIQFWGKGSEYDATAKLLPDHRWQERHPVSRSFGETAIVANAPTEVANWRGTGLDAMGFAGANGLVGDFSFASGAFSIMALISLSSTGAGFRVAFGLSDNNNDMRIGFSGLKGYIFGAASSGFLTSANVFSDYDTAALVEWSFDPEGDGMAVRVNGGPWEFQALTSSAQIPQSHTPTIGFTSSDGDYPITCEIAEFIQFKVPVQNSAFAGIGNDARAYLADLAGITLP